MKTYAYIFDLDNTLYDYDAAHEQGYAALFRCARSLTGMGAEEFGGADRAAMAEQARRCGENSAAVHSRLIRYQILLENAGVPFCHAPELLDAYWGAFLSAVEPDPAVRRVLENLKAAGHGVGLGTNMTADFQYEKLRKLNLLDVPDFIVTSEEAGAEKPEARFFALCVRKAGRSAGACVFVGDDLKRDALGAKAAGLIPVWLDVKGTGAAPEGVRRIARIGELT